MELKLTKKQQKFIEVLLDMANGDLMNCLDCYAAPFKKELIELRTMFLCEGKETPDDSGNCIKPVVTVSLPLSNEQILKGIQTSPRYQLPKEWLKNDHTNSNYMGGFLNAVKWMEGNAR